MADLGTTYLGLSLRGPVIAGSCGLTKDADAVRACADAGAGAVVMKSIFEEQVRGDFDPDASSFRDATYHPEAYEYFRADLATRYGAREYCTRLESAASAVPIPVLASLNCFSAATWVGFARDLENAGAAAIEVNIAFPPLAEMEMSPDERLKQWEELLSSLRSAVNLPLTVKLPPMGAFVVPVARRLAKAGARGLVCFNRFLVPVIDPETMEVEEGVDLSSPSEAGATRRYIALLAGRMGKIDIAAAGGVHTGAEVIRMLLAGARTVQVVSILYREGLESIGTMHEAVASWMERKGYKDLEAFRAAVAPAPEDLDSVFGRFQYIRTLTESPHPIGE